MSRPLPSSLSASVLSVGVVCRCCLSVLSVLFVGGVVGGVVGVGIAVVKL